MSYTIKWLGPNILIDEVYNRTYDFRWDKRCSMAPGRSTFYLERDEDKWWEWNPKEPFKMLHPVPDRVQEAYDLGVLMGDITDENIL